mmetsp:Transcript_24601/g.46446  ORF Transcript_24601/g.46446 Transcript_24601/m.46446 type:complete len:286 (-) Transcript_24601:774-1631(-)
MDSVAAMGGHIGSCQNLVFVASLQQSNVFNFITLHQVRNFADVICAKLIVLLHNCCFIKNTTIGAAQLTAKLPSQPVSLAAVGRLRWCSPWVLISCVLGNCDAVQRVRIAHIRDAGAEDEIDAALLVIAASLSIPNSAMKERRVGLAQAASIFEREGVAVHIYSVYACLIWVNPRGRKVRLLAHAVQVVEMGGITIGLRRFGGEVARDEVSIVPHRDALASTFTAEISAAHILLKDGINNGVVPALLELINNVAILDGNALSLVLLQERSQELSARAHVKLAKVR